MPLPDHDHDSEPYPRDTHFIRGLRELLLIAAWLWLCAEKAWRWIWRK